jgi:outer membrane protein assembly factor BamD (BamD/ComL family)
LAEPAKDESLERLCQTELIEKEEHYYYSGYEAYDKQDWVQAIDRLGTVVKMQTGSYLNREALYFLARTYYLQENYTKARQYFTQYLAELPASNYYDAASIFWVPALIKMVMWRIRMAFEMLAEAER